MLVIVSPADSAACACWLMLGVGGGIATGLPLEISQLCAVAYCSCVHITAPGGNVPSGE